MCVSSCVCVRVYVCDFIRFHPCVLVLVCVYVYVFVFVLEQLLIIMKIQYFSNVQ